MKHILIMGSGAVGGFYGAHLAQTKGIEVTFIARGAHLDAMQKRGLEVTGEKKMRLYPVRAVEKPIDTDPSPDLILMAVKSFDTHKCLDHINRVIGQNTQILTLQNGLENYEMLADTFGAKKTIRGLCKIGVEVTAPGVIDYRGFSSVLFGEEDGSESERVISLQKTMEASGISSRISGNIQKQAWKKFIWNGIFNMMTGITGATTNKIFKYQECYDMAWQLFLEIRSIAKAEGVDISFDDGRKIIEQTKELGAFRTSTMQDRLNGKPLEYDAFCGFISRKAELYEINAPVNKSLFALYKMLEPAG